MFANKINVFCLLCLSLLLASCQPEYSDKERVIYTRDMMFACEGPNYRIFRVVDKATEPHRIVNLPVNFDVIDNEQDRQLKKEYNLFVSLDYEPKDDLMGLDILPVFQTRDEEIQFQEQIKGFPWCYIYSFTGTFKSKHQFLVQSYQVIPVSQTCINDSFKHFLSSE